MDNNFCEERRKMRFEQVERMLNSDVTVAEWCRLNHMAESTMYHWLKIYRESEGDNSKRKGWIKIERKEIKDSKALVPTNTSAPILSNVFPNAACNDSDTSQVHTRPITIRTNGVEVDVFANTAQQDIKRVLEVVATL